jgi:nitroreductase
MKLLTAAVQAPSTENEQPWAFVIVEHKDLLKKYSNRAKRFLLGSLDDASLHEYREALADREFNLFYDADSCGHLREER